MGTVSVKHKFCHMKFLFLPCSLTVKGGRKIGREKNDNCTINGELTKQCNASFGMLIMTLAVVFQDFKSDTKLAQFQR